MENFFFLLFHRGCQLTRVIKYTCAIALGVFCINFCIFLSQIVQIMMIYMDLSLLLIFLQETYGQLYSDIKCMKLIIYGTYLDISILSQIKISMKTNVNYLTIVQPRQVEIYRNLFVATFQILSAFSLISRMVLTSTNINSILS